MKNEITVEEWLHELERVSAENADAEGFMTLAELRVQLKRGNDWIRRQLQAARLAGRLETRRVMRQNITGVWHGEPGYRILPAKKEKRQR